MDAVDVQNSELELPLPLPTAGLLSIEELMGLVADRLRQPKLDNPMFLQLTSLYFKLQEQLKVPRIESGKKRGRPFGAKSRSKEEKLKANVNDLVKQIEYERKLDGQMNAVREG